MTMPNKCSGTQAHYNRFLAEHYLWMAGGFAENAGRNRAFFKGRRIIPNTSGIALDLGAGCGFQSIPLADLGFRVTAMDISQPMLDELRYQDPDHRIQILMGDIRDFHLWSGKRPELITCMGDTLTHLPDPAAVPALFRQCFAELVPGGTLVLSFRDYADEPEGTVAVIPVRRDDQKIFLCRIRYDRDQVLVTDIVFSHEAGSWVRMSGTYRKLRIHPAQAREWLEREGLTVTDCREQDGMITIIAGKS